MTRSGPLWQCLLFAIFGFSVAAPGAEVRVGNREEFAEALRNAQPGTTILLAAGTYRGGISRANLRGTKEQPILIAAADAAQPPVLEGGLHLSSPEYLELRDLVMAKATGNGLNIDDSGSTATPARHIVLKNLTVRDVGPTGNRDGIKLSGVTDFRVEGCTIERWGSNGSAIDMVGCHRGLVKECKFREGGDGANGVQMKGGSSQVVVQRCRFENAGGRAVNVGGSTGLPYFRPADAKFEAASITVEDCEFINGMAPIAFVGVDGALVQHNTIYRPRRWAIRILQENTDARFVACQNGRFINNLVAFRSDEVREFVNIGPHTRPESFEFSGNWWHCLDRPADTQRFVRLPSAETKGVYGQDPGFKDAEHGDLLTTNRQATPAGVRRSSP